MRGPKHDILAAEKPASEFPIAFVVCLLGISAVRAGSLSQTSSVSYFCRQTTTHAILGDKARFARPVDRTWSWHSRTRRKVAQGVIPKVALEPKPG